jgi:hypothetical protein
MNALQNKHLLNIGKQVLDIQPPLSNDAAKTNPVAAVRVSLEDKQDCANSKGNDPCNPDMHEWVIMAAIPRLLATNQVDLWPGTSLSSYFNPGANSTSHDGTCDPQQKRMNIITQTCAAPKVDPEQFALMHSGNSGQPPDPDIGQQQQQPDQVRPAPAGKVLGTGVQPPALDSLVEQIGQADPNSYSSLLAILQQQQLTHKAMMDKQSIQLDKILNLLELAQGTKAPPSSSLPSVSSGSSTQSAGRVGIMAPRNAERFKRFKPNQGSAKGDNKANGNTNGESRKSSLVVGIPIDWYTSNKICIKYNTGNCNETATHTSTNGKHNLKHICAGCLRLEKGEDPSHRARNCAFKDQFFA